MSQRLFQSGGVLLARRAVFDTFLELYPDADPYDMDAAGRAVWAGIRERGGSAWRALAKRSTLVAGRSTYGPDLATHWLRHPEKYSPYVDWVAVNKALAFNTRALDNLSVLEREVVATELAFMPDHWRGFTTTQQELSHYGDAFPGIASLRAGGQAGVQTVVVDRARAAAFERLDRKHRAVYYKLRAEGRRRFGLEPDVSDNGLAGMAVA